MRAADCQRRPWFARQVPQLPNLEWYERTPEVAPPTYRQSWKARDARMKPERCAAIAKDGRPCHARPVDGGGLCAWHSPAWAAKRREWSQKGGVQRSNQSRARKQYEAGTLSPSEVQGLLGTTLRAVISGQIAPGQGQAVAALARAAMTVREASEVEERLTTLEYRAGLNSEGRTA